MGVRADIGVIGGTGFYALAEGMREVPVATPYGEPSDPVALGTLAGREVAFLPRHGRDHRLPAHAVNYRANIWALRSLGVRQILAPAAVGSLRPELGPGTIVVPDQIVDRTSGRAQTFYDSGAVHVSFADPYCAVGRAAVLAAGAPGESTSGAGESASGAGGAVDGGTMVVVQGPRFSTRAESAWFAAQGWSLVNMTGHPEAVLARELGLCYTAIALVTDLDAGVDAASAVRQEDVFAQFARGIDRLRALVGTALDRLPLTRDCACAHALDGMTLPFELP